MKREYSEVIKKFVTNISSKDEEKFIESSFINGEDNDSLRDELKKDWEDILNENSEAGPDLNFILDRIHHTIRKREQLKKKKGYHRLINIYMRVAAILLIPLLIAGAIIRNFSSAKQKSTESSFVSLYAPLGSRITFKLPDGTDGMLNSGSTLKHEIPFDHNRNVEIMGEAWFDVTHDSANPLTVFTGVSKVRVLGTTFNISAYPDENYVEVVLEEGKIEYADEKTEEQIELAPSERLIHHNGILNRQNTDPSKYSGWTKGYLVFRGDPMMEVARRVERWYNVEIKLSDKELEKYSFRGTFIDEKLEEVLRYLSLTSPISHEIKERVLLPDGTFEKEEIIINLKK